MVDRKATIKIRTPTIDIFWEEEDDIDVDVIQLF